MAKNNIAKQLAWSKIGYVAPIVYPISHISANKFDQKLKKIVSDSFGVNYWIKEEEVARATL